MRISSAEVSRVAAESGFRPEYVEKVLWLMQLLSGLGRHPFLDGKLALKGGTALNLFCYPLPRLSVDIDLNYTAAASRDEMLAERPSIERAIEGVCQRLGITVRRQPAGHGGGKWLLKYPASTTPTGNLELDVNYMLRLPLWPVTRRDSVSLGKQVCTGVPVLDLHELAAGKLAALFARSAARDIFDSVRLLQDTRMDGERLRLGFVVYGAMSRLDWRSIQGDSVQFREEDFAREVSVLMQRPHEMEAPWATLAEQCRDLVTQKLLPLRDNETEFLRLVNEEGVLRPALLTADKGLLTIISSHPALQWKIRNVREHRGLDPNE